MNVSQIKDALFKKATIFETGGFQPTEKLGESWVGKVLWGKKGETTPQNYDPIFTLFLNELPYVPKELTKYQLITVYISLDVYDHLIEDNLAPYFKINCYTDLNNLHKINNQSSEIRAFPLKPKMIENDTPLWDSDEIHSNVNIITALEQLEKNDGIEYYDDIVENTYTSHKVGGYPSFAQNSISFDGYSFAFQISSDEKAHFNIVDDGSFYFFYNQEKQDWIVYCDFL